jgi:hypothetical protein
MTANTAEDQTLTALIIPLLKIGLIYLPDHFLITLSKKIYIRQLEYKYYLANVPNCSRER